MDMIPRPAAPPDPALYVPGASLLYGVWIEGEGFLRVLDTAVFADHRRPVAESAASFIARARVVIIDEGPITKLESRFLAEESARDAQRQAALQALSERRTARQPLARSARWLRSIGGSIRKRASHGLP